MTCHSFTELKRERVTLNKEKCQFYTTEISFHGHIVNEKGASRAIQNAPRPTNVSEMRCFLGMLNQLNKFSLHLAEQTKRIQDLLSNKKQWYWGPNQKKAFLELLELKESLYTEKYLALFEPNRQMIVSADASAYGLSAVLCQKQPDGSLRLIAHVSRAMTECEHRYAQIEKEALALTSACKRLNQYLLESTFLLETDHKPLVPLLSMKNLEDLPIRIQRFNLQMMRYQYDIKHIPGKELNTADFLSRSPLPNIGISELQEETEACINLIASHLPATDRRLTKIKEHEEKDPTLLKWKKDIQQGRRKKKCMRFGDLSIHNGLMMRSNRIVIPKDLQQEVLSELHSDHLGIHKCKERAHCSLWWPGINVDIEEYIKKCRVCCQFQRPQFEPLCPSELPDTPWQKVGTDLFEWKQVSYLFVVDYYSRFIEIAKLSSTTSRGVINHLKSIFTRHGIPQIVVSDNGPQYLSSEFSQFARDNKYNHITSSPHFPQANRESERAVQTLKGLLKQSNDLYLALLAYHSTPLKLGYSPAELVMGRALRTTIPIPLEQLQPKLPNSKELRKKDKEMKIKQKENYDNRHKTSEQYIL